MPLLSTTSLGLGSSPGSGAGSGDLEGTSPGLRRHLTSDNGVDDGNGEREAPSRTPVAGVLPSGLCHP